MVSIPPQPIVHNLDPNSPFYGAPVAIGLGLLHSASVHLLDEATIRQTIQELQKLDDHALEAIGLRRSDIETEVRNAQKTRLMDSFGKGNPAPE